MKRLKRLFNNIPLMDEDRTITQHIVGGICDCIYLIFWIAIITVALTMLCAIIYTFYYRIMDIGLLPILKDLGKIIGSMILVAALVISMIALYEWSKKGNLDRLI